MHVGIIILFYTQYLLYSIHLLYGIKVIPLESGKCHNQICIIVRFALRWKEHKTGYTRYLQIWSTRYPIVWLFVSNFTTHNSMIICITTIFLQDVKYSSREFEHFLYDKKKRRKKVWRLSRPRMVADIRFVCVKCVCHMSAQYNDTGRILTHALGRMNVGARLVAQE